MQVLISQVDELKKQVQMQMKDFSMIQQLDKQVVNLKKKDTTETSQLNEVSKISSKLLDIYFMLEEEYELEIYKISDENLQMKDEADEIALDFAFKVGNLSIGLLNFCFKMSLKSKDIDSRFSKSQLEDLLVININYVRKLLDITDAKQHEDFITSICQTNLLILDLLRDQLEYSENLQNMNFCNEYNLLEIQSLNPKINFTDILKHSKVILILFDQYKQLEKSQKNTLENLLIILFSQVQDCQTKKVDELLQLIQQHPLLIEFTDASYKAHYLKLQLINAIDHKDNKLLEKTEIEFSKIDQFDPSDYFFVILNIRKLKINSDEQSIKQALSFIEEYQVKYKPITNEELSQLLLEISNIGIKFFYITFNIFQKYILNQKSQYIQDNRIQESFYDTLIIFSSLVDEFFSNKDSKKYIETILESFKDCLKQIIGIILAVKKLVLSDINNQQVFYQRVCKLILEVVVNLKDLKEQPINHAIEIIEIFLLLLKKQQKENAQHQTFIDEVSCIGLICALKVNNQKSIKDFSHNIEDCFGLLPKILVAQTKKNEISPNECQKFLTSLLRLNGQQSENQNLITIFAFKNLLCLMEQQEDALLEFYMNFIEQNFDEYFFFFRKNFIENYLDRTPDISLSTPFVRKIIFLKQNLVNNIGAIQDTTKMLFIVIERFYKYFSTKDKNIPLTVLMTAQERKEIIEINHTYFSDGNVSSDPRISCKFLHYIILYSCLEIVFDNTCIHPFQESTYLNQCIYKLNYTLNLKNQQNSATPSYCTLLTNPYFLRSLVLLYCYQVIFYEVSMNQSNLPQNSLVVLENLIESYELTSINLMDFLNEIDEKLVKEQIKNQFYTFQFIFTILKSNITKSLSVIEIFLREYPEQLVLLSQICKTKQNFDLVQIINKKYIYYLSSRNYEVESYSLELILDLVEQLQDGNQIESSYIPVKMILKKIINTNKISPSQFETIYYIFKELISKLKILNPNHPEIQELNQLQKRIKQR